MCKLEDVSKNLISKMSAENVYNYVLLWAKEYNDQWYNMLNNNK